MKYDNNASGPSKLSCDSHDTSSAYKSMPKKGDKGVDKSMLSGVSESKVFMNVPAKSEGKVDKSVMTTSPSVPYKKF